MAGDERLTYPKGDVRQPLEGHRKVISWPELRAAVGYVGLAHVWTGRWMDEELELFMRSKEWATLEEFARALPVKLATLIPAGKPQALKVSVTGFGRDSGSETEPELWHIRNTEWDRIPDPNVFRIDEDLRTTAIADTPAVIRAHLWVARWIGRHDAYSRRAHSAINNDGSRSRTIDELGRWARREIPRVRREIAAMLREERAALRRQGRAPAEWEPEAPMNVGPRARAVLITRTAVSEQRDEPNVGQR